MRVQVDEHPAGDGTARAADYPPGCGAQSSAGSGPDGGVSWGRRCGGSGSSGRTTSLRPELSPRRGWWICGSCAVGSDGRPYGSSSKSRSPYDGGGPYDGGWS